MKKWLRRTLIALVMVALTLVSLYEAATHVGRGWLRGEAFYESRPTSYWRNKIDDWTGRFDRPEDARRSIDLVIIEANFKDTKIERIEKIVRLTHQMPVWSGPWTPRPKPRRQSWVTEFLNTFRLGDSGQHDDLPPKVLWGWYGAEAVLPELAEDAKYRPLVERAMRNVEFRQAVREDGGEPTLSFDPPGIDIL